MSSTIDIPRIFIINLKNRVDRKNYMERQLEQFGLSFQFVDAISGNALQDKHRSVYRRYLSYKSIGRELIDNEIGCYWSHYSVWEKIVAEEIEEAIICEDDIIVNDMFSSLISNRFSWLPSDWGIINFAWDTNDNHVYEDVVQISGFPDYKLFRFPIHVDRASCYMLNHSSAKVLMNKAFPIFRPVDSFLGSKKFHGLSIYGIMPRLAVWNEGIPSSILQDGRSLQSRSYSSRHSLLGFLYRILARIDVLVDKVFCRK